MKSWAERIRDNQSLLSKTEDGIIEYIRENPEKAAFMSQAELCGEAEVSKPLVISCFRKLGYEDFRSFKNGIKDFYSDQITSYQASSVVFRETRNIKELIEHSIHVDLQALASMEKLIDPEQIKKIAERINSSHRIFILSDSTGHYPSHYIQKRLLRYGKNSILAGPDRSRMLDEMSSIGPEDTMINFHYTQPKKLIRSILTFTKERNGYSILVTGKLDTELVHLADQTVFVPRGQIDFKNSMAVPMWFANLLLLAVELNGGKPLQEHLKKLENYRETLG